MNEKKRCEERIRLDRPFPLEKERVFESERERERVIFRIRDLCTRLLINNSCLLMQYLNQNFL